MKKDRSDINKAKKSIEMAEYKLSQAKSLFDAKIFDMAIAGAYSVMFHAARALLFRDGIREKSHYGVYVYIREKYKDKLEPRFINELNTLRLERHEIFYGLEKTEIKEVEAENIITVSKDFLETIKKLI